MEKGGWVYIMANRYRGGTYVGVTFDLIRRVWQHREDEGSIHVKDFGKTRLVYAERHEEIEPAIAREKLVKKWRREWKFALIEADNPDWLELVGSGHSVAPHLVQARGISSGPNENIVRTLPSRCHMGVRQCEHFQK